MKRIIIPVIMVLSMAGSAHAIFDISTGVYGGVNAPVVQEDVKAGTDLGVKIKFAPAPFLAGSVFYEWRKYNNPEVTIGDVTYTTDGGKVKVFGFEGMLGAPGGGIGPHFYGMAGIFNYKWTRTNFATLSKVGYNVGAGLEMVFPGSLGFEGQAKFEIVPTTGGGSRKNALVTLGVNYHFGMGM